MRIEVLAYIEDDKLQIGVRSNTPSMECGLFDGEYYFNYYSAINDPIEIMTMDIVPLGNLTYDIYVEGDLYETISPNNSSSNFSIDV